MYVCSVFLGLQIACMVQTPKLVEASLAEQNAYQIYKETSYDDIAYTERWDAWRTANGEVRNLSRTTENLSFGSIFAVAFAHIAYFPVKPKNNGNNNDSGDGIK